MKSHYEFTVIMSECQFNPETRNWELPARFFADLEADSTLYFSSKYEASKYVYGRI